MSDPTPPPRRRFVTVGASLKFTPAHAATTLAALDFLLSVVRRDTMVHNLNVVGVSEEMLDDALAAIREVAGSR